MVVMPAALVWSACVGDDPSLGGSGAADGERGGNCFANNTCNGGGLACIDHLCVLPGDGEAGVDGSKVGDSATSDASDGGADVGPEAAACLTAPTVRTTVGPQCYAGGSLSKCAMSSATPVCCVGTETCTALGSCNAVDRPHQCESAEHCPAGTVCCMSPVVQLPGGSTCPPSIPASQFRQTIFQADCTGFTRLCSSSDPCPGPLRCLATEVGLQGTGADVLTITVGICVP
jgi:hypothetical protein